MINFDDFTKLDIRIGEIISAEKVDGADRLLRLMVDVGEEEERQIVSGIAEHFPEPEILVGRQVPVLINLEPRTIRGVESRGMILYIVGLKPFLNDGSPDSAKRNLGEDLLTTMEPSEKMPNGTPVK